MTSNPYAVLEGQFILHETIGSGGFAKVKLATHILTGEKVAIKIMDKKSLGDDLPRVQSEVSALKELCHQHICRLYQVIDTRDRIFLVLEHCSGGELFDYIVKKDRLPEPEARHFFRQIVQAMAYVHSKGYAHRDLKPENLLLAEDLQLKLIDFGLCAKPETGLTRVLETCCGSPAYAAPELISGNVYFGNEADIWSMGVLLFALLCGFLPFEDDNLQIMYKKIQTGKYDEPPWLSEGSRSILKAMLQTNPRQRATIEQLLVHPWVIADYRIPLVTLKWRSVYEPVVVDRECIVEMAIYYDCTSEQMLDRVQEWQYGELSCIYFLLLQKKHLKKPVVLPPAPRKSRTAWSKAPTIIRSPTIHGSLECDLNKFGADDGRNMSDEISNRKSHGSLESPCTKPIDEMSQKSSYSRAISIESDPLTPYIAKRTSKKTNKIIDKENDQPSENGDIVNTDDILDMLHSTDTMTSKDTEKNVSQKGSVAVYCTPAGKAIRKVPMLNAQIVGIQEDTPLGAQFRLMVNEDAEIEKLAPPSSDKIHDRFRSPRAKTKGAPLPRRVFNSMERQMDRMITALTPKRYRTTGTPVKIRHTQTLVNVSTTSSKSPEKVLNELLRVFEDKGISCKQKEWTIRGKAKDKDGHTTLTLELEVVFVDRLNMVGIRRKRLNGPSFMYKRICEDILNLAGL